jgi:hypothetical protein
VVGAFVTLVNGKRSVQKKKKKEEKGTVRKGLSCGW